jgi:membrane protein
MLGLDSSVTWKELAGRVYEKMNETDLFGRAAQVGFYFSFAFFPLLLFLLTLFGLVLDSTDRLKSELYRYLADLLPRSAYILVRTTMDEIVESSSGGKLTLGLFVTLWSASAGVDSLKSSLNAVYEVHATESWWKSKLKSLVLTLLFILLLAFALGIVTAGMQLLNSLLEKAGVADPSTALLAVVQWTSLLIVMLLATAVVYSWLPSFEKFRWVWISPGSVVAILLWIALTAAFKLYLHYFNTYNKAYGSLGAVIILMLWMYLTGFAVLIGGAINSVLTELADTSGAAEAPAESTEHQIRELKKQQPDD